MRVGVVITALFIMINAHADSVRDGGTADYMCCKDKACTQIEVQKADSVRAYIACQDLTNADGATRWWRSNAFKVTPDVPVEPPPVVTCSPAPASTTRAGACPAGTTGSWQQTSTSVVGPAPSCTVTTTWAPTDPPAGACTAVPPPPLTAPANLAATIAPNQATPANSNVTLTWTAVDGASEYEVQRCAGETCNNFAYISPDATSTTWVNNNLPPGLTYRYKVRVWRLVSGAQTSGPFTNPINVTTPTSPVTPPPQANGSATVEWQHDGADVTAFKVVYGVAPDALVSWVDVPNPTLRASIVDKLASGKWYFSVRALNGTAESANGLTADGQLASKVVP